MVCGDHERLDCWKSLGNPMIIDALQNIHMQPKNLRYMLSARECDSDLMEDLIL